MEITSDTVKIRLAAFQIEGESQVWWDWVKTSRDLEAMTWRDFRELFMSKFFPAFVRHAKAWEFCDAPSPAPEVGVERGCHAS